MYYKYTPPKLPPVVSKIITTTQTELQEDLKSSLVVTRKHGEKMFWEDHTHSQPLYDIFEMFNMFVETHKKFPCNLLIEFCLYYALIQNAEIINLKKEYFSDTDFTGMIKKLLNLNVIFFIKI